MQIEWWYWIIAGFGLIVFDLIIPSFTLIWFGLGALVVGLVYGLYPGIPVAGQIALWPVASVSFIAMWYKYLKPKRDSIHARIFKEGIVGESGVIIHSSEDNSGRGIVKFHVSVLGADEWDCYSSETLHVGDRVRVIDIEGQTVEVEII